MTRFWLMVALALTGCDGEPAAAEADVPPSPPPDDMGAANLDADEPDQQILRDDVGEPCESNEECRSGFCVLVRGQERVCTKKCGNDDECPEDWICRQVTNAGADVTFICVPEDAPCAGADLTTDPEHCGECDHACEYPGADGVCAESACGMGACDRGFHDLDGDDSNGCEYPCTVTRGGDEACDEIDNDCDGATDEGIDTERSVGHCGGCGQACAPPNATGACVGGACTIDGCADGFADADGEVGNGCELGCAPTNGGVEACDGIDNDCDDAVDEGVDVQADPGNCGACGVRCDRANAVTGCVDAECTFEGCAEGFFDINGDQGDGCEVGCQRSNGGLEACDNVDNDCDGSVDEDIDLTADPVNCAACGVRCDRANAMTACQDGRCALVGCADGFFDRNVDPRDGCEVACQRSNGGVEACDEIDNDCDGVSDEGIDLEENPVHCGACGVRCDRPNAVTGCAGGECTFDGCVEGFFDRNGRGDDGCEVGCQRSNGGVEACDSVDNDCDGSVDEGIDLLENPDHCGRCLNSCSRPGGITACRAGRCAFDGCADGFHDLDGRPENGCEYACVGADPPVEACNDGDDDCDGAVDEDFQLARDPGNCGRCQRVCRYNHADGLCSDGDCGMGDCEAGWVDLDGRDVTGCEYRCSVSAGGVELCDETDNDCDGETDEGIDLLTDPRNCGACGNRCALDHADAICAQANCRVGECEPGWRDTDRDPETGCECQLSNGGNEACDGGDNDCDGLVDEGFDFENNPNHCGRCGRRCRLDNAEVRCAEGDCELVACEDGWANVDGNDGNGCEHDCGADPAPEECGGAPPDFDYDGRFQLLPKFRYQCDLDFLGQVEEVLLVDMEFLTLAEGGNVLNATGVAGRREGGPPGALSPLRLQQNPIANDGGFTVTAQVGAAVGCAETFIIAGRFDDDDRWVGSIAIQFRGDLCAFTTCRDVVRQVTGVRVAQ